MNLLPLPEALLEDDEVTKAWDHFGTVLLNLERELSGLADDTVFEISSGKTVIGNVPVTDYRNKLAKMTWSLTLKDYTNGGVGAVVSTWSDQARRTGWLSAAEEIRSDSFLGYARDGDAGLYYLATHETAHVTELGLATGEDCAADYRDRTHAANYNDYPPSPEWKTNEVVANLIAKQVCERLGFPVLDNASEGYTFSVAPAWLHSWLNANRKPSCCGGSIPV